MLIEAAVLREPQGDFHIEALELEAPRADEVLVKIAGAGICHTDLLCRDQDYPVPLPVVLGHEGSGIVEAVGEGVTGLSPGDHVVLSYKSCGVCGNCISGRRSRCDAIFEANFSCAREDGSSALCCSGSRVNSHFFSQSSFATYALASQANTVKVADDVPLELLGPLGCGFQTGAGAVMNSLNAQAGSSIGIFGCGSVGLSAVMAAAAVGCGEIIAVDPNAKRRELARELGATVTVDPSYRDPVAAVQGSTGGGCDFSLECTGIPGVLRQALEALNVSGVCGVVGASRPGTEVTLDMNSIMFGRTVKGIIEGDSIPALFIPKLVDLFRRGRFPIDRLVSFYDLADIQRAVEDSEQGLVVKAIVCP